MFNNRVSNRKYGIEEKFKAANKLGRWPCYFSIKYVYGNIKTWEGEEKCR